MTKRALQAIRKGQPLIFQWRGDYLTRDRLVRLCVLLEQAAQQKQQHARVSLNWPQAVLQAEFVAATPETEFTSQEANEGELN